MRFEYYRQLLEASLPELFFPSTFMSEIATLRSQ